MQKIEIHAKTEYPVILGVGILPEAGTYLRAVSSARKAAVISDERVFPLYGKVLTQALERAGVEYAVYTVPCGEGSKTLTVFSELLSFLAGQQIRRGDLLLSLGGGVVGDLTGFAAACYLRGIDYVQIPTTLLAMADSSVGGKTGVDLPEGKNLCGAFWQPSLVLADTDTLSTLPEQERLCGMGEIVKYAVLDGAIWKKLQSGFSEEVLADCIRYKAAVVEEDERDLGARQLLNLGHTFGHAIEFCSGFKVPHGQAVAAGLGIMVRAAWRKGFLSSEDRDGILGLLDACGLPSDTDIPPEKLLGACMQDKKLRGSEITLIVPTAIGCCIPLRIPASELESWLNAGGALWK